MSGDDGRRSGLTKGEPGLMNAAPGRTQVAHRGMQNPEQEQSRGRLI